MKEKLHLFYIIPIAQRIRETFPEGETGLLFIGSAHDAGLLLGDEIRISTPEMISCALPEVLYYETSIVWGRR